MYKEIRKVLDKTFIETKHVARTLSLAIEGKKNCILWGRAGLAKSEMVSSMIKGLGYEDDTFIQFFGEGMDESRLYGGLNIQKFTEESIQEYQPEQSFLNFKYAVFEEIFDAPAMALLALKDTLTAKCMRNGMQQFPMKTESIIAITNRSPSEISEMGPHCHALIERFPIQLNVEWDNYNSKNYLKMFNKRHKKVSDFIRETLAELVGEVNNSKNGFVSPRSAIHALETLNIAFETQGLNEIDTFKCLTYIPGFESVLDDLERRIEHATVRRECNKALQVVEQNLLNINNNIDQIMTSEEYLEGSTELNKLVYALQHNMKTPDELVEKRDVLIEQVRHTSDKLIKEARKLTDGDSDLQALSSEEDTDDDDKEIPF